jgi:1-acyl-sn-glycerol-3-phosphate acyltransferase
VSPPPPPPPSLDQSATSAAVVATADAAAPPVKATSYIYRGEGKGWLQVLAWNAGRTVSRVFSVLLFRLHVGGQARLPKQGGVLMVTNHQSFLDPWLIGIAPSRQVHYMARDTLFKGGFLHYLMELWNAFPVKRGAADLGAIRMAVDVLDRGYMLNIFPEGTRSEDGSIGAVAPGMVLILNRCKVDVPIVPVVIDGAYEAWPRGRKMPKLWGGRIRIVYGRPIPASEWRAMGADALALRVRGELVKLQREMGSVHAGESERRLREDAAKAGEKPVRKRRERAG